MRRHYSVYGRNYYTYHHRRDEIPPCATQVTLRRGHTVDVKVEHRIGGKIGKGVKTVEQRHVAVEAIKKHAVTGIEQGCHCHKQHKHHAGLVATIKVLVQCYHYDPKAANKHWKGSKYEIGHLIVLLVKIFQMQSYEIFSIYTV